MQNTVPDVIPAERKVVHVAVGVIVGDDGRVLLAKRPDSKHMGGLWEFPGGKVESDEAVTDALKREIKEELDIDVTHFSPLICIRHDYPDKTVLLDTWVVTGITGDAKGNEGQLIEWVEKQCLEEYEFPAANKAILRAFTLPDSYMITGHFEHKSELYSKISAAMDKGVRLIQFRAHWMDKATYLEIAEELSNVVQARDGALLIKGESVLLNESWCHGLHLRSHQLNAEFKSMDRGNKLLAVSCHDEQQIQQAQALGVDFITVSPVKKTKTHPEAKLLGDDAAGVLTAAAVIPVYWLGGMALKDIENARKHGAQGIAAINVFW